MARRVRVGGTCVLTLVTLCGCPPGPSPGPITPQLGNYEAASPIASGIYVTAYGRTDGITMFRADPAPLGTWVSIDHGLTHLHQVATDPRDPAIVYAVGAVSTNSSTSRIRKSSDAGASWATLLDSVQSFGSLIPDPGVTDRVWISIQGGVGSPTIQRSDDGGSTWVIDDAGLPGGHVVRSLTFDAAAASGVRYVALSDGKTYRADAIGGAYAEVTAPFPNIQADPGVPDRVYAWAGGGQLARSDDRGATWTQLPGGSVVGIRSNGVMFFLTSDPSDPDRLYLSLCPHGVWYSDDGGQTFQPTGLNQETVLRVDVDPTDPTQLLAHTYSGPWLSDDRGVSWRQLDTTTVSQEPFAGSPAAPPGGGLGKSTP